MVTAVDGITLLADGDGVLGFLSTVFDSFVAPVVDDPIPVSVVLRRWRMGSASERHFRIRLSGRIEVKTTFFLDMSEYTCGEVEDATVPVAGPDGAWFDSGHIFCGSSGGFGLIPRSSYVSGSVRIVPDVFLKRSHSTCQSLEIILVFSRNAWFDSGYNLRDNSEGFLGLISRVSRVMPFSALEADSVDSSFLCGPTVNSHPEVVSVLFSAVPEKCARLMPQLPCGPTVNTDPEVTVPRFPWTRLFL